MEKLVPNQMIITFEDTSIMQQVKKTLSLLRGVKTIKIEKPKKLSPFEQSCLEVERGEVHEAKDIEDLIRQLNN